MNGLSVSTSQIGTRSDQSAKAVCRLWHGGEDQLSTQRHRENEPLSRMLFTAKQSQITEKSTDEGVIGV